MKVKELLAALSVLLTMVGVPVLVRAYHANQVLSSAPAGAKVFTLSGVADNGVWTLESVNGTNYWWKTFEPATIKVEEGDQVALRLQSADVHHRFYIPSLNVGPIEIEPGHTKVVVFKANSLGAHRYYCTSICGDCHFYMSGWIVVLPKKGASPKVPEDDSCLHELDVPPKKDMVRWGRYLHRKMGCITCHGKDGRGGVVNFNYIKKTVPPHNTLAKSFHLEEKEDAEAFINLLLKRVDFDQLKERPDIPRFNLVLAQYKAAKKLIREGKNCAKLDRKGPEPPLQMPSWQAKLTERDIESIIAYLLTLYQWEEEEDEE